jgi:DNA (cytosine-5)-methyltransferase 1
LASGISKRMGKLRGYGNSIVAPLAAEFVAAYMDCCPS